MSAAVKNIVKALEAYTSCDIADALTKLKVPHGGFLPGLTMWSPERQSGPTKICGPAYTVQYVRHDDNNKTPKQRAPPPPFATAPGQTQASTTPPPPPKPPGHYIDSIPPSHILFISAPPHMINACYGGLMSTRALYLSCSGTIVDGRIRDLAEHRSLNFPVFARDVGTTAPAEEARVNSINEAVKVNSDVGQEEAWVYPGDWLVADLNGVVCVPKGLVEEVVGLVGSQVEADERVAEDIRRGEKAGEAMKRHRAGVKMPKLV